MTPWGSRRYNGCAKRCSPSLSLHHHLLATGSEREQQEQPRIVICHLCLTCLGRNNPPPPMRPSSSLSLLSEAEKCLPQWCDLTSHQSNMAAEMWDKVKILLLSEEGDVNLQLLVYFSNSYSPNWTGTRNHPSDEIKYLQLKCLNPRIPTNFSFAGVNAHRQYPTTRLLEKVEKCCPCEGRTEINSNN